MDEDDLSRWSIVNDPFDLQAFDRVYRASPRMKEALDPKRLATARQLGDDVFSSLFKYVPKLRPSEEVDPAYLFNRSLIEKAMGTQEYERLRAVTQLEEAESGIATEIIAEELMKHLPEEDRQAVNDHAKAQKNLQRAASQLKALSELTKLTPALKAQQTRIQKALPQLQQAAQQAQPAFNATCQNPQLKAMFRAAVNHAMQEIANVSDFAGGWGLEPGQMSKVPAKDRMDLMRRIAGSQKIRELSKLMGRYKRLAFQKRYTRVTTEPSEVVDVRLSSDVTRVLPTELMFLAEPGLEILFYEKVATRRLLTYEMRSRESFGRGPIIFCVDNSGSMGMGAGGVTREMWAKATGLAMAEIALKDKRTIEFINFGSRSEIQKIVVEPTLPPQERVRRMIEFAETFFNGGTDFERPLGEALKDVDRSEFRKADVVIITDGECDFSEEFEKEFKEVRDKKGFRLHSVIIGGTAESLERISDGIHHLYDLLSDGDAIAGNLFEAL